MATVLKTGDKFTTGSFSGVVKRVEDGWIYYDHPDGLGMGGVQRELKIPARHARRVDESAADLIERMIQDTARGVDPALIAEAALDEGDGSPLGYGVVALKKEIDAGKLDATREACEAWLRENMRHLDDQWIKLVCDRLQDLKILPAGAQAAKVVSEGEKFRLRVGGTRLGNIFETAVAAAQFAEAAGFVVEGDEEDPDDSMDGDDSESGDDDTDEAQVYQIKALAKGTLVTEGEGVELLMLPAKTRGLVEALLPGGACLFVVSETADRSVAGRTVALDRGLLEAYEDDDDEQDEAQMSELLWSGKGDDYGYRIYRDPDGDIYAMVSQAKKSVSGSWLPQNKKLSPKDLPKRIRQELEKQLTASQTESVSYRFYGTDGATLGEHRGPDQASALAQLLESGQCLQNVDLTRIEEAQSQQISGGGIFLGTVDPDRTLRVFHKSFTALGKALAGEIGAKFVPEFGGGYTGADRKRAIKALMGGGEIKITGHNEKFTLDQLGVTLDERRIDETSAYDIQKSRTSEARAIGLHWIRRDGKVVGSIEQDQQTKDYVAVLGNKHWSTVATDKQGRGGSPSEALKSLVKSGDMHEASLDEAKSGIRSFTAQDRSMYPQAKAWTSHGKEDPLIAELGPEHKPRAGGPWGDGYVVADAKGIELGLELESGDEERLYIATGKPPADQAEGRERMAALLAALKATKKIPAGWRQVG